MAIEQCLPKFCPPDSICVMLVPPPNSKRATQTPPALSCRQPRALPRSSRARSTSSKFTLVLSVVASHLSSPLAGSTSQSVALIMRVSPANCSPWPPLKGAVSSAAGISERVLSDGVFEANGVKGAANINSISSSARYDARHTLRSAPMGPRESGVRLKGSAWWIERERVEISIWKRVAPVERRVGVKWHCD